LTDVPQPAPNIQVLRTPLTLRIRCERTSDIWSFLPRHAEPPHVFEERLRVLWFAALRIKIFVAQHQRAVVFVCALVRDVEGARVS
jgi:hypothetical protein